MFTGLTKKPPFEIADSFGKGKPSGRDNFSELVIERHGFLFQRPLININKKGIREIYDYFKLTSTLFPLTRSCESNKVLKGHCGKCWFCQERNWGFE